MNFQRTTWRLIKSPQAQGTWNMALDEAILEFAGRGEVLPTLRFYQWLPPCLSLGFAQSFNDVNFERLQSLSWDLVRRPTGGRAILHTDELTYSIMGPESERRLSGGVMESYRILAEAFLYGLRLLNVRATILEYPAQIPSNSNQPPLHPDAQNPVCFEVPSNYEIVVGGKKLIGSAQARRKKSVLQHGTLPLTGDLARIVEVLAFKNSSDQEQARQRLLNRASTLEQILGYPPDCESIATGLIDGFSKVLEIDFQEDTPTEAELVRAGDLMIGKYSNPEWTMRI